MPSTFFSYFNFIFSVFFIVCGFYLFFINSKLYLVGRRDKQSLFTGICALCSAGINIVSIIENPFLMFTTSWGSYLYNYITVLFMFFYCYGITNTVSLSSHRKPRQICTIIIFILIILILCISVSYYPINERPIISMLTSNRTDGNYIRSQIMMFHTPLETNCITLSIFRVVFAIVTYAAIMGFNIIYHNETEKNVVTICITLIAFAQVSIPIMAIIDEDFCYHYFIGAIYVLIMSYLVKIAMLVICYISFHAHNIRQSAKTQIKTFTVDTIKIVINSQLTVEQKENKIDEYLDSQKEILNSHKICSKDIEKAISRIDPTLKNHIKKSLRCILKR